jgi:ribosomal protein S16
MDNFINVASKIIVFCLNDPAISAAITGAVVTAVGAIVSKAMKNKEIKKVVEMLGVFEPEEIANRVKLTLAQIKKIAEEKAAKK